MVGDSLVNLRINAIVWFGWFGTWAILELLGYWHVTPWVTLSEFVWRLDAFGGWVPFVFFLGLCILAAHLATRWP